ncbi:MAG: DNA topoisomerase VI subunit B [Phycisphaerales bacterium]|nr:DNA topoisomerase VI subunit B [Phycisphaerales bacterium]
MARKVRNQAGAGGNPDTPGKPGRRATAETLAAKQQDIAVSEFFAKNRHLLGFDNPRKSLLTTVKEAVDNSLDACEEAGILPEITVAIEDLQPDRPANAKQSRYRVTVIDNGPGIVRRQVENVFGRLLFGSKFHRLKMSRGQQGIGISAAGMYGLLTTGKPMIIHTRPKANEPAHHIELAMNTKTNRAEVTVDDETEDFPPVRVEGLAPGTRQLASRGEFLARESHATGTSVSIELEGRYQRGRGSVDEFLELTAIANPHARIIFVPPSRVSGEETDELLPAAPSPAAPSAPGPAEGPPAPPTPGFDFAIRTEVHEGVVIFPRAVAELPPETKEIQPHPKGVELGMLLQMMKDAESRDKDPSLFLFLQERFCRVSSATASSLCHKVGLTSRTRLSDVDPPTAEKLFRELQEAKLPPPPTDCLAPIGVRQLLAGLLKGVRADFYAASSREAAVYRGRPFQIEAALAFGGELPGDESARVIRFANRVPLLYQQSACSSFKAVGELNWRNYNMQQPRGGPPVGPLVVMLHMASVWVPFTSESKEAIADYDEIRKEMKLALMECARKLAAYLRKRERVKREGDRRDVFKKYIGEIAQACAALTGDDPKALYDALSEQARDKTATADMSIDEDGRFIKDDPGEEDGVIVVNNSGPGAPPSAAPAPGASARDDAPPVALSRAERAALQVASRAKDEAEAKPPKRRARPEASSKPPTRAPGTPPAPERTSASRPAVAAAPVASPSAAVAAPTAPVSGKPRTTLRWVNGKLTKIEDLGLFPQ